MMLDLFITHYKEPWEICHYLLDTIACQRGIDFNDLRVLVVNDGDEVLLVQEHFANYPYRIEYLRAHIQCMREVVEEGVDLFGYTTWGGLDLIAASTGEISKRYGFIYVDMDDQGNGTFKRYKKDSFYWYKKVCESNGEEL